MTEFQNKVYCAVKSISKGSVASYGQAAVLAGYPKAARAVGHVLHNNPDPQNVPCHRVVYADGRLAKEYAFGGIKAQSIRLQAEGIPVTLHKVDIKSYKMP